jgi:hypothetical protein
LRSRGRTDRHPGSALVPGDQGNRHRVDGGSPKPPPTTRLPAPIPPTPLQRALVRKVCGRGKNTLNPEGPLRSRWLHQDRSLGLGSLTRAATPWSWLPSIGLCRNVSRRSSPTKRRISRSGDGTGNQLGFLGLRQSPGSDLQGHPSSVPGTTGGATDRTFRRASTSRYIQGGVTIGA